MQLIFDSRYDGLGQARLAIAMLSAYVAGTAASTVAGEAVTPVATAETPLPPPTPDTASAAEPLPPFGQKPVADIPPPPPAQSAPAASSSEPDESPAAGDAQRTHDARGIPYDARIHAANRAVIANGNWRKKKGLNDEGLIKRIEAELMAGPNYRPVAAAPAPQPIPAPPPGGTAVIPPPPTVTEPPPQMAPAAAAAPPAPPPVAAVSDPNTYEGFVKWIGQMIGAKRLVFSDVNDAVGAVGLEPKLPSLLAHPEFVPVVYADLSSRFGN